MLGDAGLVAVVGIRLRSDSGHRVSSRLLCAPGAPASGAPAHVVLGRELVYFLTAGALRSAAARVDLPSAPGSSTANGTDPPVASRVAGTAVA